LLLPAYSQIFNGELGGLDRTQVLVFNIVDYTVYLYIFIVKRQFI